MAEAAVEDSVTNRFYCHKCSIEITRVLEDYTCPTCRGGFIEELESTQTVSDDLSDVPSEDDLEELVFDMLNPLDPFVFDRTSGRRTQNRDPAPNADGDPAEGEGTGARYRNGNFTFTLRPSVIALITSLLSSNRVRNHHNSVRSQNRRNEAHVNPVNQIIEDFYSLPGLGQFMDGNIFGRYTNSIENSIQDFIVNLTGLNWGAMAPPGQDDQVFFVGNPGDYAWGREGLDAIITQLLNQMDVTGPPPLDKEKIREIPVTVIEQEQVDSNLQCSVCWDDFKIGEPVRKLECEHFYHELCIVPWLELHGTCPICRKQLLNDQKEKTPFNGSNNTNSSRSNIATLLHAVRSRASNIRSASSSSTSSTSTSSSNSSNGRQPPPPPSSDYQMDLEYDQS